MEDLESNFKQMEERYKRASKRLELERRGLCSLMQAQYTAEARLRAWPLSPAPGQYAYSKDFYERSFADAKQKVANQQKVVDAASKEALRRMSDRDLANKLLDSAKRAVNEAVEKLKAQTEEGTNKEVVSPAETQPATVIEDDWLTDYDFTPSSAPQQTVRKISFGEDNREDHQSVERLKDTTANDDSVQTRDEEVAREAEQTPGVESVQEDETGEKTRQEEADRLREAETERQRAIERIDQMMEELGAKETAEQTAAEERDKQIADAQEKISELDAQRGSSISTRSYLDRLQKR